MRGQVRKLAAGVLLGTALAAAQGAVLPRLSSEDPHIGYFTYQAGNVFVVDVERGVATRIVLDPTEAIVQAGTGFAADCKKNSLAWCIHADQGTNEIWIKPRQGATYNNLEVQTTKRSYSFRFNVVPHKHSSVEQVMYRVVFQYPITVPPVPPRLLGQGPASAAGRARAGLVKTELDLRPVPKNTKYSMQAIDGGKLIEPSLAFDDGRFTYFRFPNNESIPAPFVIGPDGQEQTANFHMEKGGWMVIHQVARRFVLRMGKAVVGVWNDAYDPNGVATPTSTTSPYVVRTITKSPEVAAK